MISRNPKLGFSTWACGMQRACQPYDPHLVPWAENWSCPLFGRFAAFQKFGAFSSVC